MSERGWAPFARQHRGYLHEGPFGYPAGAKDQNRPVVIVSHRMGGHKSTLDNDAWRFANHVGVTFGVGRYRVGDIDQYCSMWDAHWGNGIAGSVPKYDRANPRLRALELEGAWRARPEYSPGAHSLDSGGVNVLNSRSVSIEHEDANTDVPWPDALLQNSITVHKWIVEECNRYGIAFTVDEHALAGHFQIDAVNRPGCPGAHWPKAKILAALEDDVKPYLVWDKDRTRIYLVGPKGAAWITDPVKVAQLEADLGKLAVAYSAATIDALNA